MYYIRQHCIEVFDHYPSSHLTSVCKQDYTQRTGRAWEEENFSFLGGGVEVLD